jgi:hypothetical protein
MLRIASAVALKKISPAIPMPGFLVIHQTGMRSSCACRSDTPMRFREPAKKCCLSQQLVARETHRENTVLRGARLVMLTALKYAW